VRPWQHVLAALHGYLLLAERLLAGDRQFAEGWNFGPSEEDARPVRWIVERMRAAWGDAAPPPEADTGPRPHEAGLLRLDSSRARAELGWRPALGLAETIEWIAEWHKAVGRGDDARAVTLEQIERYMALVGGKKASGLAA
jgi:CDP-glucose 4,6-dehydratase